MSLNIQIFFIIAVMIYLIIIIDLLRKKKLNLRYSLLWLICGSLLLVITVFPKIMYLISDFIGIKTPINTALIIAGMFIVMILITITSIVSKLNNTTRVLTQELALLKKKIEDIYEDENKGE